MGETDYLNVPDAARMWGLSEAGLRRAIGEGLVAHEWRDWKHGSYAVVPASAEGAAKAVCSARRARPREGASLGHEPAVLAACLAEVNHAAKRQANASQRQYRQRHHGLSRVASTKKGNYYRLKDRVVGAAMHKGDAEIIGRHELRDGYGFLYIALWGYHVHRPVRFRPEHSRLPLVGEGELNLSPKRQKVRIADAVTTLESYVQSAGGMAVLPPVEHPPREEDRRAKGYQECWECGGRWTGTECLDCGRGDTEYDD